tara:strand:+ start:287 stop:499 length:213 start_codon:yes stop_codon:yes gene_type:complete
MILEDLTNNLSKIVKSGTEAQLSNIEMLNLNYFTVISNLNKQGVASHISQLLMHTRVALNLERENSGFSM